VTSSIDQETADSIDWQGRMLKYLYPKDKGWASHEDRKRRRSIVTELGSEHRMLAKESLVLDVNVAAAKAERDRAFESRRLGELEAHVQADTDVADLNAQAARLVHPGGGGAPMSGGSDPHGAAAGFVSVNLDFMYSLIW